MTHPPEMTHPTHRSGAWLLAAALALMLLACLAGALINQAGIPVNGERVHLRLQSAITDYPFCPPQIPCPFSAILPNDHWVVWVLRESDRPAGEITFRKIIDIPLGW